MNAINESNVLLVMNVINDFVKSHTFVIPKPFLSTFAEFKIDGTTRLCSLRSPLL